MIRSALALLFLLLVPYLTGCWDRLEVNDLAVVDMVGLDQSKSGIRLTVSVVVPDRMKATSADGGGGGKGGGASPNVIYTAEGESVMNAISKVQERVSRRLFWAHTRLLVLGEEFARSGVRPGLDYWSRHREPRLRIQVAVTPGRAADFLQARPRLEKLLSDAVRETLISHIQAEVTLNDFLDAIRSDTEQPIAPRVTLIPASGGQDALVSGTAIFREDRLLGWLDDADTRGLLWLRGQMETGVATIRIPSGGTVSMMLMRGHTTVRPEFQSGRLRLVITAVADDDLYESSAPIDLGDPETIHVIEQLLGQDVQSRMQSALRRLQREFGVDSARFGDVVWRRYPVQWQRQLKAQWPELFTRLPIEVRASAHVRRTGGLSAPLSVKKGRVKSTPKELLRTKG